MSNTHQGLHHEHTLGPHLLHKGIHVHRRLLVDPLQHGVQGDERTGATHTSTAVDQERALVLVVTALGLTDERDERGGKLGHSMIRPGGEVIVGHPQGLGTGILSLHEGGTEQGQEVTVTTEHP